MKLSVGTLVLEGCAGRRYLVLTNKVFRPDRMLSDSCAVLMRYLRAPSNLMIDSVTSLEYARIPDLRCRNGVV